MIFKIIHRTLSCSNFLDTVHHILDFIESFLTILNYKVFVRIYINTIFID